MKPTAPKTCEADPRLPLLRAIQREVDERRRALCAAEDMLLALALAPRHHGEEIARLRSEVSLQRRELRQVARELGRLGIAFDAEDPHTLVALDLAPEPAEGTLGETGFRRRIGHGHPGPLHRFVCERAGWGLVPPGF